MEKRRFSRLPRVAPPARGTVWTALLSRIIIVANFNLKLVLNILALCGRSTCTCEEGAPRHGADEVARGRTARGTSRRGGCPDGAHLRLRTPLPWLAVPCAACVARASATRRVMASRSPGGA
eukprot:scaffold1265_cov366-Prasinococcus_capsulatus_cf.AAC.1